MSQLSVKLENQLIGRLHSWLSWTRRPFRWALLFVLLLAGCGKSGVDLALVSGRVTLDGQPMYGARLMFQPEASGSSPSYGTTDREGRYELGYKRGQKGARIGWHTVRIESPAEHTGPNGKTGSPGKPLPPRYNTRSEIRREVKADDENEFNFELKSDAK